MIVSIRNRLLQEWTKITSTESADGLPYVFFRVVQAFQILGLLYYSVFVLPLLLSSEPEVWAATSHFVFLSGVIPLVVAGLAELGIRRLESKPMVAVWIGTLLSLKFVFSMGILLGAFGLYAFYNQKSQRRYLKDAPAGLRSLLIKVGYNKIDVDPNQSK